MHQTPSRLRFYIAGIFGWHHERPMRLINIGNTGKTKKHSHMMLVLTHGCAQRRELTQQKIPLRGCFPFKAAIKTGTVRHRPAAASDSWLALPTLLGQACPLQRPMKSLRPGCNGLRQLFAVSHPTGITWVVVLGFGCC